MSETTAMPDPDEQVPDHVPTSWLSGFGSARARRVPNRTEPTCSTGSELATTPPAAAADPQVVDSSPPAGDEHADSVESTPQPPAPLTPVPKALDRLFLAFYATIGALALWGQTAGLARILHDGSEDPGPTWSNRLTWYLVPAVFAFAIELIAAMLLHWGDWRRIERNEESALPYVAYGFAGVIAAAVAGLNWYGHHGGVAGGLFAGASLTFIGLWFLRSYGRRKDALRARGLLVDIPAGVEKPVGERAKELAKRDPGHDSWVYIDRARAEIDREQRHAAVRKAIEEEFATSSDARLALGVLDLDRIAADLSRSVDYRSIGGRLADRLTADRVTSGRPTGKPRPAGRPTDKADRDRPTSRKPTGRHDRSVAPATGGTTDRLAAAYKRLSAELGREPSGKELGDAAGCSKSVANDWKRDQSTDRSGDRTEAGQ